MKNLLILCRKQFGYHIDTFKYCEYLKDNYKITYLCWNYNLNKISADKINVIYVNRNKNIFIRYFMFVATAIKHTSNFEGICIIKYFPLSSILTLLPQKPLLVLDIRTSCISRSKYKRLLENILLKLESIPFHHITIISKSLSDKLKLKNTHLLPLGADETCSINRVFDKISLLYVGTFEERELERTIFGLKLFVDKYSEEININYTIVGNGSEADTKRIEKAIKDMELEDIVQLIGYVPHNELSPYFEQSTIGVSFVPTKDYFDCQPPTKTFEYILSGMPVIATSTKENINIVNDINGIIIDSHEMGFFYGLESIFKNLESYQSDIIRDSLKEYNWGNIIKNNLSPYLDDVVSSSMIKQTLR